MSEERENLTLALLRKIDTKLDILRLEVAYIRDVMATKTDIVDVRLETTRLRADVVSDLLSLEKRMDEREKRLGDRSVALRQSAMEPHSSAIGDGLLLTEFDERLRRSERHVGLPPETH